MNCFLNYDIFREKSKPEKQLYSSKSSFFFENKVLKYNKVIASPNKSRMMKMEVIGSNNGNNPTINIIARITHTKFIITFI